MRQLQNAPLLVVFMALASLAMLLPAAHGALMSDYLIGRAFFYSSLALLLICTMIAIARGAYRAANPARSHAIALIAAYGVLPPMLALPMVQAGVGIGFGAAWFDMLSAMTTTGAPMFTGQDVPMTITLWRAMVGWMGGLFILVMAATVLLPMGLGGAEVVAAKPMAQFDLNADAKSSPQSKRRARGALGAALLLIFPIYGAFTLMLWIALTLAGETSFTALITAMAVLSTSGISEAGGHVAQNSGFLGEAVIFIFMAAALSRHNLPSRASQGRMTRGDRFYDPEMRLGLLIVALTSAALFVYHWIGRTPPSDATPLGAIWGGLLLGLSFLSTTGLTSASTQEALDWAGLVSPGLMLMGLAIIGGGAATAAGGVKLLRIYALLRHGERELERLVHPHSLGGAGQTARYIRRTGAISAWVFFILFALSIGAGTAALTLTGMGFDASIGFVIAAITNTGPLATSLPDMPLSWGDLGGAQMAILGAIMVAGRIELLVLLAVFSPDTWRF
jgi:trk system potassium uptake protein